MMIHIEGGVASAYGGCGFTLKCTIPDIIKIVAGMQLLGHHLQDVEVIDPRQLACDDILDAFLIKK